MKTSNFTTRIAVLALFFGVLIYFGFYAYHSYTGGLTTVLAYTDSVNVGLEATGLLVREEQVLTLPGSSSTVELSPAEGERVAEGDVVATLYTSALGLETKQSIRTLEAELEQLRYALRSSASAADSTKVESDLLAAIAGLHASASAGDLTGLESDALQLRTLVFRRDYTYGDTAATQELQALIQTRTEQLDRLRASLGAASTVLCAPRAGVFSGLADGYEQLITPAMLEHITPSVLDGIMRQGGAPPADAVGALVTSSTWYFTAGVPAEEAARLRTGHSYVVVFSWDYSGEIVMKLERISDEEDGRVALVFSCRTHLADVTLLRSQTVDIVTEQITGIRIPRSVLRAIPQTRKNQETGEDETVTVTGVYKVVSQQAEFTPVNVLYQGEDFFLVEPVDPDAGSRLRPGDELIVYTAGIFDGKVVR